MSLCQLAAVLLFVVVSPAMAMSCYTDGSGFVYISGYADYFDRPLNVVDFGSDASIGLGICRCLGYQKYVSQVQAVNGAWHPVRRPKSCSSSVNPWCDMSGPPFTQSNGYYGTIITCGCNVGYSAAAKCTKCSAGYFGYPTCATECSSAVHCSGRAISVARLYNNVTLQTSCVCSCARYFSGPTCALCKRGYDPKTGCLSCSNGYEGFPSCRTLTATVSATISPLPPPSQSVSSATVGALSRSATLLTSNTLSFPNPSKSYSQSTTATSSPSLAGPQSASSTRTTTVDPTKRRAVNSKDLLSLVIPNEAAATAIVDTSAVASVLSSLSVSTAASNTRRIDSLIASLRCGYTSSDDLSPDRASLPIQCSIGTSAAALLIGSTLLTCVVCIVFPAGVVLGLHGALHSKRVSLRERAVRWQEVAVTMTCTLHSYFAPSIVGSSVLVMSQYRGELPVALAAVSLVSVLIFVITPCVLVARLSVEVAEDGGTVRPLWDVQVPSHVTLRRFVEAAADVRSLPSRLYYFEDTAASCLLAAFVSLPSLGSCAAGAVIAALIALLHFAYIVGVRPYASRVDAGFALVNAAEQLALGVVIVFAVAYNVNLLVAGALVFLLSATLVLQAVIACCIECIRTARRRHVEAAAVPDTESAGETNCIPLLLLAPQLDRVENS